MIVATATWLDVLTSLIVALPGLAAAIAAILTHRQVKPPSGGKLGDVAERSLSLAAIANEHTRRNSVKLDSLQAAQLEREGGNDAAA